MQGDARRLHVTWRDHEGQRPAHSLEHLVVEVLNELDEAFEGQLLGSAWRPGAAAAVAGDGGVEGASQLDAVEVAERGDLDEFRLGEKGRGRWREVRQGRGREGNREESQEARGSVRKQGQGECPPWK